MTTQTTPGASFLNDDILDSLEETLREHGVGACRKAASICLREVIMGIATEFDGAPNYGDTFKEGYGHAVWEIIHFLEGVD